MVREYRQICFSMDELIESIVSYDQVADQILTCGHVSSGTIKDDPNISLQVEVWMHGTSKTITSMINEEYIGAALAMYCLKHGIPIPRHAVRYLKRLNGDVALCLSMNEEIDGPATILPPFFNFDARCVESSAT